MNLAIIVIYTSILVAISVFDLKYRLILDKINYPAMLLALILAPFSSSGFWLSVLGGVTGFLLMFTFAVLAKGGMGFGDVKLAALIGLMVGFPNVVAVFALSWIVGGLIVIVLKLLKHFSRNYFKKINQREIPFAPAMAVATVVMMWR